MWSLLPKTLIVGLLLVMQSQTVHAREVTLEHNGLTLNGNLEMAPGRDFTDGMVVIIHGILAHNGMEIVTTTQQALRDIERSSLAVNLSLGMDNRHGFYDCDQDHTHVQDHALSEIEAWIDWLQSRGVNSVILLGHSYGANQIMAYMMERKNPSISHLIFLAPNTINSLRKANQRRYGDEVLQNIEQAQRMIAKGDGHKFIDNIDYLLCPKARVTAQSFASYYGTDAEKRFYNFTSHLPALSIPTLVTTGTADERQPDIAKQVLPYVDGKTIHLSVIEGAGHFFRDFNIEEAMEAAVAFIERF